MSELFSKEGFYIPGFRDTPRVEGRSPYNPDCWLATHGRWEGPGDMPPCSGRLRKCHLIDKQVLLKELPPEVSAELMWDPRVWVWGCGGSSGFGNNGHHGHFDVTKKLRIPRSAIPRELEELLKQFDLDWWLDRTYKRRAMSGAHRTMRVADPDR